MLPSLHSQLWIVHGRKKMFCAIFALLGFCKVRLSIFLYSLKILQKKNSQRRNDWAKNFLVEWQTFRFNKLQNGTWLQNQANLLNILLTWNFFKNNNSPLAHVPDLAQEALAQDPVPALALQEDTTNAAEAMAAVATLHVTATTPAETETTKVADVDTHHQEECMLINNFFSMIKWKFWAISLIIIFFVKHSRHTRNEEDTKNSSTLFVGNLAFNVKESNVRELFGEGKVKNVKLGVNRKTGHGDGYAFVRFHDRKDAEDAFKKYAGYEFFNRNLRVDWDVDFEKKQQSRAEPYGFVCLWSYLLNICSIDTAERLITTLL